MRSTEALGPTDQQLRAVLMPYSLITPLGAGDSLWKGQGCDREKGTTGPKGSHLREAPPRLIPNRIPNRSFRFSHEWDFKPVSLEFPDERPRGSA